MAHYVSVLSKVTILSYISYALLRKTAFDEKYRTCWSRRLESSIWLLTFFLLLSRDYRPPLFKHLTSSLSPIIMKSVVLLGSRPPVLIGARPRQTTWQKSIYKSQSTQWKQLWWRFLPAGLKKRINQLSMGFSFAMAVKRRYKHSTGRSHAIKY